MTAFTKGPVLGLAEAARVCGVSVSTIRRKRLELAEHGAAQTAKGWQIPVTALIAVGLMGRTTPPPETPPVETPEAPHEALLKPLSDALREELDTLRSQLADAERRAAVAEAVAAERERIIQVQQMSLRMLEAGNSPAEDPEKSADRVSGPAPVAAPAVEQPTVTAPRAGWLSRFKRLKS